MRYARSGFVLGAIGFVLLNTGCDALFVGLTEDCEFMLSCEKYRGRGNGVTPADCVPSTNAEPVDDTCGVFVSASGNDASAGTKGAPVKTLAAALAAAERGESRRVYACAETFDENVEVTGSASIFGALDCANGWAWAGTTRKTTLSAAEGTIPLVVRGGDASANVTVRVENVAVTARGISPFEKAKRGLSSIAVVVENVNLELARCALEAGDGATGVDGAPAETNGSPGSDGNSGGKACSAVAVFPGGGNKNDCGTPDDPSDDSIGGSGGTGAEDVGGVGTRGTPRAAANGGQGEDAMMACTNGTDGESGTSGEPGAGASGLGEISAAGYTGPLGTNGTKGKTAQGGGGGGAKGGTGATKCETATSAGGAGGAGGGSGGAGGCGGVGGKGGGAGGASITLLSLNAQLHFDSVTLKTGRGGTGGQGGEGQTGGRGGGPGGALPAGATGLHAGCAGGNGGYGGNGGRGGGGLGGPSIGIAFRDAAPALQGVTITTGEPGVGGLGADADHSGAAGVKSDAQEF